MRAKTRAVAAATGAALVVVPLTGAAAAALVTDESADSGARLDAAAYTAYSNDIADIPEVTTASKKKDAYTIDTPTVKVKVPPPPEPEPEPVVVEDTTSYESTTSTATTVSSVETTTTPSADVQAAISGSAVIAEASKYVGVPYVSGGSTPSGFDCSGFVSYVYGQLGISLPRSSGSYYSVGTRVSTPQPGDIIVTPGHVAIYAGPNLQIDAATPGTTIQFRAIWQTGQVYVRVT
ncbi:C40 family peptidase [Demequina maris]|uniref:C40 family peptidase n=1 Tax=Demequina maris TaxID=1638982 RepID=UPI0009E25179|nr:C40 family peptidase [Demequina maris]